MKKTLLLLFLLTACGFSPMYNGSDIDIYVDTISGTNGIELRNALNTKFGGPHSEMAKYKLTVQLETPETRYKALERTGDATWQEVSLRANYTITCGNKTVTTGTETASESYTFVRYLVASNASYNNAVQNTISVLANKIGAKSIAATKNFEDK